VRLDSKQAEKKVQHWRGIAIAACEQCGRNRVPEVTFLLLFGLSTVAVGFIGYGAGLVGTRQRVPTAIMAVSIALVIMLIADLDRPRRGLITVDQQALTDVREGLAK